MQICAVLLTHPISRGSPAPPEAEGQPLWVTEMNSTGSISIIFCGGGFRSSESRKTVQSRKTRVPPKCIPIKSSWVCCRVVSLVPHICQGTLKIPTHLPDSGARWSQELCQGRHVSLVINLRVDAGLLCCFIQEWSHRI